MTRSVNYACIALIAASVPFVTLQIFAMPKDKNTETPSSSHAEIYQESNLKQSTVTQVSNFKSQNQQQPIKVAQRETPQATDTKKPTKKQKLSLPDIIKLSTEFLESNPKRSDPKERPAVLTVRAEAYHVLKDYDKALADLNEALNTKDRDRLPRAIMLRAKIWMLQGKFEAGRQELDQLIKETPPMYLYDVGQFLKLYGRKMILEGNEVASNTREFWGNHEIKIQEGNRTAGNYWRAALKFNKLGSQINAGGKYDALSRFGNQSMIQDFMKASLNFEVAKKLSIIDISIPTSRLERDLKNSRVFNAKVEAFDRAELINAMALVIALTPQSKNLNEQELKWIDNYLGEVQKGSPVVAQVRSYLKQLAAESKLTLSSNEVMQKLKVYYLEKMIEEIDNEDLSDNDLRLAAAYLKRSANILLEDDPVSKERMIRSIQLLDPNPNKPIKLTSYNDFVPVKSRSYNPPKKKDDYSSQFPKSKMLPSLPQETVSGLTLQAALRQGSLFEGTMNQPEYEPFHVKLLIQNVNGTSFTGELDFPINTVDRLSKRGGLQIFGKLKVAGTISSDQTISFSDGEYLRKGTYHDTVTRSDSADRKYTGTFQQGTIKGTWTAGGKQYPYQLEIKQLSSKD